MPGKAVEVYACGGVERVEMGIGRAVSQALQRFWHLKPNREFDFGKTKRYKTTSFLFLLLFVKMKSLFLLSTETG